MATSIVVPTSADIGAFADEVATEYVTEKGSYDPRVANAVIDVATAAAADINALQAGTSITGVNGVSMPAGGALATGSVLRATGPATAAYGQVDLADTDAVTGELPGANQALAVAAGTQGAITGADKTHINATMATQVTTGTLVAGTATINTVITVAANSEVVAYPDGAIAGSTNFGCLQELRASRAAGGPGVGTIVIQAVGNDGLIDADATGAFHALIFTPHA